MFPLLGNFALKEILTMSHNGPTASNDDDPLISAWLIPNTLTWTSTSYYRTEKLVGAQEISVEWMNELVGLGQAASWGRMNCLSKATGEECRMYSVFFFFQISMSCPKTVILGKVLWCRTVGEGLSSWLLKMIHTWELRWEQCFEYFLRDFFSERKQSWWKWNFTAASKSVIKIKSHMTTTRIEISMQQRDFKVPANGHMCSILSAAEQ